MVGWLAGWLASRLVSLSIDKCIYFVYQFIYLFTGLPSSQETCVPCPSLRLAGPTQNIISSSTGFAMFMTKV